jgi:hypothetical protein
MVAPPVLFLSRQGLRLSAFDIIEQLDSGDVPPIRKSILWFLLSHKSLVKCEVEVR